MLTESCDLFSGCGGVDILFMEYLDAVKTLRSSESICLVLVKALRELERWICEYQRRGPVLLAGDFNAHIGTLAVQRELENRINKEFWLRTW